MPFQTKKPQADLIITWPNKTETRHVRPLADGDANANNTAATPEMEEEAYRIVMECAPYTASFNHLLSERRPNEDPRKFATLVYDRMRADNVPLNTETFNLLMGRLVRFTDGSIFDLYEQLKSEGTKVSSSVLPNKETFSLLFRACERNAEYNRAFLLYQEMRELFSLTPETSTYNTLLGFCGAVKDVAQACYYMEEMKTLGVPVDANTYNCFMSVLVDTAPYEETLEVFNRMCGSGAQPTLRSYNTLLKATRAYGDFDKGFQVYEEMKKKGCIPSIVTYNTLLWICEDRLDYVFGTGSYSHVLRSQEQKATGTAAVADLTLTLVAEMQAVGVAPNTFSYNKILAVLLRCEDPRIFSVYRKVQQACIAASAADGAFHTAVGTKGPGRSRQRATQRQPSLSTTSPVSVKSGGSGASPSTSVTLLNHNDNHHSSGGNTANHSGTNALSAVSGGSILTPHSTQLAPLEETGGGGGGSLESVMREEDPMEEPCIRAVGVRANIMTEKLIMRALLLFRQPEKCKMLHLANRKLYRYFCLPKDLALILFDVCEKTQDHAWAEALLQEVLTSRIHVDVDLFNAYLSVLATLGDPSLLEHYALMKLGIHKYGVCVNTKTCNVIMRSHLLQKRFAEGLAVFTEMCDPYASQTGELTPDDETFVLVIQLYDQLHNSEGVTEMIESSLAKGYKMGTPVFHQLLRLYAHNKSPNVELWFERLSTEGGTGESGLPALDAECYAILMDYHMTEGRYENVAKLFNELKTSQTLEPTTSVFRVVFDMYKAQGNRKAMMAAFDDARMNSIKLDVSMYNATLETFVEAKDPFVFEVLSDMRENCIPPEDSTIAIFLASSAGRQQLGEAMAHNMFYKPSSNIYL